MITERILCKTCKELDIEIIEIAVNPDHVHIFYKYPPKYSLSFIAWRLKGRTGRILRKEFPHLKDFCDDHFRAPGCYHPCIFAVLFAYKPYSRCMSAIFWTLLLCDNLCKDSILISNSAFFRRKAPKNLMYDRAMQPLYALALEPIAEITGDRTSFGFRKFRSTHDACEQAFHLLCRKNSPEWVLEGDIKGCFDNISHQWLIDNIPIDKSILKQFLKAGYVFERNLFPTEAGTPQGGIISPILANLTLDGIENLIADKYHKSRSERINSNHAANYKVNFTRYADDFIVTAKTEEIAKEVKELIISKYWHSSGKRNWVFSEGNEKLNLLSDTKIVRHTKLKLDMNPYLEKDYFILRKIKLGVKKLTGTANRVWDKVKNVWQPETVTMTNNCCPI